MPHKDVNGISMHYEVRGEGTPLLLIHGLGSSTQDWEFQVPSFEKHFKVITVDLRGHGESSKPKGPYNMELFARDLSMLLPRLTSHPCHVVGLSMGGAIAFHLALDHTRLVRSIVVTNMSAAVPIKSFAQKKFYYGRILYTRLFGTRAMGRKIAKNVLPGPEHEALRKTLIQRWGENPTRPYLDSLKALKDWSVMGRLHQIACPALLIHSEHDYTPIGHKKEVAATMKHATLMTLPGTHHMVPTEAPEDFNKVVLGFLKGMQPG